MLRLDAVNLSAKLGKRVNIKELDVIELPSKQITELGNFNAFVSLTAVRLPNNRIERVRHIEGLFGCPRLVELDLRGNPIQRMPNYRLETIAHLPGLAVLDGVPVTADERSRAVALCYGDAAAAQQAAISGAPAASTDAAVDAIFGAELAEQLKIQELIRQKHEEEEAKRQRDRVAMAAVKNATAPLVQPTWLSSPISAGPGTVPSAVAPVPAPLPRTDTPPPPPSEAAKAAGLDRAEIPKAVPINTSKPASRTNDFDDLEMGLERRRIAAPASRVGIAQPAPHAQSQSPQAGSFEALFSGRTQTAPKADDIFGGF